MRLIKNMFYRSGGQGGARAASLVHTCAVLAVLMGISAVSEAGGRYWGHGGHRHYWRGTSVGVVVGVPLGGAYLAPGPYYGWPYTWPTRTLVVEAPKPVYVERDSVPTQGLTDIGAGEDWWYYCREPKGYYPDVPRCPRGWEKVPPRPE